MKKSIILSSVLIAAMLWSCSGSGDGAQKIGYFDKATDTYGFMTAEGEFMPDTSLHAMPGIMVNGLVALGETFLPYDTTANGCYTLMADKGNGGLTPLVYHLSSCGYYAEGRIPTAKHGGEIIVRDGEGKPVFRLDSIGPKKVTRCASAYTYGLLTFELEGGMAGAVAPDGTLVIPPLIDGHKVRGINPGEQLTAVILDNDTCLFVDHTGQQQWQLARKGCHIDIHADTVFSYTGTLDMDTIEYQAYNLSGENICSGTIASQHMLEPYWPSDTTSSGHSSLLENEPYFKMLNKYMWLTHSPANPENLIAAWNKAQTDSATALSTAHYYIDWMPISHVYPGDKNRDELPIDSIALEDSISGVIISEEVLTAINEAFISRRLPLDAVPIQDYRTSRYKLLLRNGKMLNINTSMPASGGLITINDDSGWIRTRSICSIDSDGNTKVLLKGLRDAGIYSCGVIPITRMKGAFELLDKELNTVLKIHTVEGHKINRMERAMIAGKIGVWDTNDNLALIDIHGKRLTPWFKADPNSLQITPSGLYLINLRKPYGGGYYVYDNNNRLVYSYRNTYRWPISLNIYDDYVALSTGTDNTGKYRFVKRYDFNGNIIGSPATYNTDYYANHNDFYDAPAADLRDLYAYDTPSYFDQDWAYDITKKDKRYSTRTNYTVSMWAGWCY